MDGEVFRRCTARNRLVRGRFQNPRKRTLGSGPITEPYPVHHALQLALFLRGQMIKIGVHGSGSLNAKHVLRASKENVRQGFWNGSLPPIGYRVVAAEQRGAKIKKKLEIDPIHAETGRRGPKGHHRADARKIRADCSPADAPARWRLSPRPSARAGAAGRDRRRRSTHHGIEVRSAADTGRRRRFRDAAGRGAQICSEVAERVGFEPTLPLPVNRISSAAHSTTLPPLREACRSA